MEAAYVGGNVRAHCPDCEGAVTTFENKGWPTIDVPGNHEFEGGRFDFVRYAFLRCAGCGRGGMAKLHGRNNGGVVLGEFMPMSINRLSLPISVPEGIVSEFREAEDCAANYARRAASALFRSTLEKTLKSNGYVDRCNLEDRIDLAITDGVITSTRGKRAHDDVRVLGNDVLHDEWRDVSTEEVDMAHKYVQRILEDLYDDRPTVLDQLIAKGRLPDPKAAAAA